MKTEPQSTDRALPVRLKESEDINFRELFDIAWSGKWIVAAITATCFMLALAYVLVMPPVYRADGLVQVEEEKGNLSASMEELTSLIGGGPTRTAAEVALINSRLVLGEVAQKLQLDIRVRPKRILLIGGAIARWRERIWGDELVPGPGRFAWGGELLHVTALEVPKKLLGKPMMLVTTDAGYDLFNKRGEKLLSGKVGERSVAGDVSIFVQELRAGVGQRFRVERRPWQDVLKDLSEQVMAFEQPRDSGVLWVAAEARTPELAAQLVNEIERAYLRQNVERRSVQAEQSLEFLKKQLPELRSRVDEARAQLNQYQLQNGTVDVQRETDLVLKQAVELETQRLSLIQERDASLQRYTPEHPVVVTLNERLRRMERQQQDLHGRVETLPEKQQEILGLMRDVKVNEELYVALLNSVQELQVTKAGTIGNVRIVDAALPPLKWSRPNVKLVLVLGLALGLLFGIVTVFAMITLLRGVDKPEAVERALGLSTFASIPFTARQRSAWRKRRSSSEGLLAVIDKDDLAIEALRSLRTSFHFAMLDAPNNVVMVTGPTPELGKSFVSFNFAAVLAQGGKRVMLIDADLRRGRLHQHIVAAESPGLSDYIAGAADLQQVLRSTPVPGLTLIPTGTCPPNPAEILMSERLEGLLKSLSETHDYVLIDTPPVLPVTDAAIIGKHVGTTLLVLKAAEHPMRAIEETVRRLHQAGVSVRGVIFNQVGARLGSHGYGTYGAAYGYSSDGYKSNVR